MIYRMTLPLVCIMIFSATHAYSQIKEQEKVDALPVSDAKEFAPNNNTIWFSNDGSVAFNPITATAGWTYPVGNRVGVAARTGVVWTGRVAGQVRAGGSSYRQALQQGTIDLSGIPSNPNEQRFHIYYVRATDSLNGTNLDYLSWPAGDGAPIDKRGKPRIFGDEQLWFVSNDLDTVKTKNLYGTNPVGLEVRTTVWGHSIHPLLRDVVFVRHLFVNRSKQHMTDSYVSLWTDFDIGNQTDDFVGVDTSLQLSYSYNAYEKDASYGIPPAAGVMFLQTPIVPTLGRTAMMNFTLHQDYAYAPLSGYSFYINGSSVYRDPIPAAEAGANELRNNQIGQLWNPQPYIDPSSKEPTKFCVNGDPLMKKGWYDGLTIGPGERRSILSAGPFTIAARETQEVVYAMLAKRGTNNLHSVRLLKECAAWIQTYYRYLIARDFNPSVLSIPQLNVDVRYPSQSVSKVTFDVTDTLTASCNALVLSVKGAVLATVQMFDDGQHNDGAANDHHFSAEWMPPPQREGVDVVFELTYRDGFKSRWIGKRSIPLCGPMNLSGASVESDHLNQDHKANPGENVRVTFDVKNNTFFPIGKVSCIELVGKEATNEVYRIHGTIASGATARRSYSDSSRDRFATVTIPATFPSGKKYPVWFMIQDTMNNCWYDSLLINVYSFSSAVHDSPAVHIAGFGTGTLGYRIVHPAEWKGHQYKVSVRNRTIFETLLSVYDVTDQRMRIIDAQMPDEYAHDFPMIDGFVLSRGTSYLVEHDPGDTMNYIVPPLRRDYIPEQNKWYTAERIDWGPGDVLFGTVLELGDLVPIKLIFSYTNTQRGYVYLRGGTPNYIYSGFGTVPFRVYDVSDSLRPRQLAVAFVEQNASPAKDLRWMPTTSPNDREYLMIFSDSYTDTEDSAFVKRRINADAGKMNVLYASWLQRKTETSTFQEGDVLSLIPTVPISRHDTFLVATNLKRKVRHIQLDTAIIIISQKTPEMIATSRTELVFVHHDRAHVYAAVYDLLGRRVSTLIDGEFSEGEHRVAWDASSLRAGMYLYRVSTVKGSAVRRFVVVR